MKEGKYNSVIHGETKKIVTAFMLENDATWVGKEKETFYATTLYCKENQKIKMIFVKTYKKQSGKIVTCYFRKKAGEQNLKTNISGESDKHKLAKENIYEGIYSGNVKINGKQLNKEKIKNIYIEYRTVESSYVIPDIVVEFKKEDSVYGNGFVIEIQLSNQTEDKTIERNYDRLIRGFSVVWLWKSDFDNDMNFVNNNIKINPYKLSLKNINDIKEKEFLNKINRYGEVVDEKIIQLKNEANKIFIKNINDINKEIEKIKNEILNHKIKTEEGDLLIKEYISDHKKFIENKKEYLIGEIKKCNEQKIFVNTNDLKNEIEEKLKKKINSFIYKNKENISEIIEKYKDERIKEKITEEFEKKIDEEIFNVLNKIPLKKIAEEIKEKCLPKKFCPKCNKEMKIGKTISNDFKWYCENFPYCGGVIGGDKK